MSDINDQQMIREMAKITMMSNRVSDVQVKNLKMFALVFFEGVSTARIEYDVSTQRESETEIDKAGMDIKYSIKRKKASNSKVTYWLDIDPSANNNPLTYRFKSLEASVRNLFWNDIKVEVNFNGSVVYESDKNA